MTGRRLPPQPGEVIDRSRSITFSWNGRSFDAHPGDSIISALAAAGERVFSRSFKYHRPRGLLTADYHDPGTILQVDDEPNVRAAHRRVEAGMRVSSQNTWPSLRYDVKAVNQLLGRFLPPGFYYKTFIRPERLWPAYEKVLARFAHAGKVSLDTPRDRYDKRYAHPDVLVAGGGPAGITAALAAARVGARVLLVEEEHELGGHLRWGGGSELAVLAQLREAVAAHAGIEVLVNSAVLARYDENWIAVVQRGLPGVPERLIKARAGALVVATGLIERPYVFAGNDVPSVMLSTAVRRLVNLYAVRPGERAVVLTANGSGDAAVADLRRVGVDVHVADARLGDDVVRVRGRSGVRAVELADGRRIEADLLVTATGWTAPTALLNQSGDRPVYVPRAARFVPGRGLPDEVLATGGIAGDGSLDELQRHADAVGAEAARRALVRRRARLDTLPTRRDPVPTEPVSGSPVIPDLPLDEHPELFRGPTHGMVDFSEDVSSADIHTAVGEGYDSVELLKRYTTVTMGPAQGKLETVNVVAVLAEATGRTIAETGTTTWRPMHVPITLGALAGRIHEPVRVSPLQPSHQRLGARPLVAGQWIRPDHYGDPAAEVRAVREGVGIIDVTPIGKLDLHGPDVPKLLDLLYVNRFSTLPVGRVRYGVMCAEDGVVLDDGVTGRLAPDRWLMSTTSSGAATVWEWVESWLQTELSPETSTQWRVHVTPLTTALASINVAGPRSRELVGRLAEGLDLSDEAFGYMNVRAGRLAGIDGCVLWRIGFTGELSYELHVPAGFGLHVWEALLGHGSDLGVAPFGMEAQRILRLEKGHAIVGQDTDGLTKAYSAGLAALVKLDKDDFVGRPELVWQHEAGTGPRLVGLQPVDGSEVPPEASQIVAARGSDGGSPIIGRVTSSRMSPTLHRSVCLAQLDAAHAAAGTQVDVQLPDGRRIAAHVMSQLAHFDPEGHRLRAGSAAPVGPVRPTSTPVAISAVTLAPGHRRISGAESGLTLADLGSLAKISIRAPQDGVAAAALGTGFGRAVRSAHGELVVGSGPGEWLVLGDPGTQDALSTRLQDFGSSDEFVSVVDLTHGRALLRLRGWHSADLLGKVCAMDLSDDAAPDGAALRTSVAHVVTDLIRDDQGSSPAYLLHCERSSGQYLVDALLDAGAEFGIGCIADSTVPALSFRR